MNIVYVYTVGVKPVFILSVCVCVCGSHMCKAYLCGRYICMCVGIMCACEPDVCGEMSICVSLIYLTLRCICV